MESTLYRAYIETEIGTLEVSASEEAIVSLYFVEQRKFPESESPPPVLLTCAEQLDQYFRKTRTRFSLKLTPAGTAFEQQVWNTLLTVPYGRTASYRDIAAAIGNPQAVRAVGRANGRNPISIIIPCHRVIGSNGKLIGYGGGLWRKEWLLRHEGSLLL